MEGARPAAARPLPNVSTLGAGPGPGQEQEQAALELEQALELEPEPERRPGALPRDGGPTHYTAGAAPPAAVGGTAPVSEGDSPWPYGHNCGTIYVTHQAYCMISMKGDLQNSTGDPRRHARH